MNCEQARQLLDAYIDGELTAEEMRALEDHAKACEMCMEELQAAKLLKDTLAHMDDDIAVPLQAQAAWRNAVRAEAKKKNMRKWMRAGYAVAAVLVLALGLNLAHDMPESQQAPLMVRSMDMEGVFVETDGAAQPAAYTPSVENYTVFKKLAAASVDEAKGTLESLALEYSGSFSSTDEALCRIEIPSDYLDDFLKAASRIGEEQLSEVHENNAEMALILIQLLKV